METVDVPTRELAGMTSRWNPRLIGDDDLNALRRSLKHFGTVEPIVVNKRSGRIVGGHQRVKAALAEKIEALPVVYVDLDDPSEKQLNLALNRIHGEWDEEKLAALIRELEAGGADLALTGFAEEEIKRLMAEVTGGLTDPDAIPEPPDDPVTQPGDLIVLGNHRLLCGDSSIAADVARLMDGKLAGLVHTDPPYNVKLESRSNNSIATALSAGARHKSMPRKTKGMTQHQQLDLARHPDKAKPTTKKMRPKDRELVNDFLPPEKFVQLLNAWFQNLSSNLKLGGAFYIWGGYANLLNYPAAIEAAELYFSQGIIWDKQWPVLTRKDFMGAHEWAFYGWKAGAAHYFNPDITNAQDVWHVQKVAPPSMVHLTEKPVELAELAMTYSSRHDEIVLDLFGGSGSTLIAAERMGRRAFVMEIDRAYCDVIVTRWQNYTGKKASGWRGND